MNILLISHQLDYSGAPLALLEMARVFVSEQHNVTLVSLREGPLKHSFEDLGVEISSLGQPLRKPQLVIANTVLTIPVSHMLRKEGIRVVNWVHESKWFFNALRIDAAKFRFDQVSEVLVPSQFMVQELSSLFPNALFAVLPNLVDIVKTEVVVKNDWIVVPGSWEHRKGQQQFVEFLAQANIQLPLRFLGAAPQALNVNGTFEFTGQINHENAKLAIASSRILISPAVSETQNLSALEAIAQKVPVLLSDIPAHRELSIYFGGLPLFTPGKVGSFRSGMARAELDATSDSILEERRALLNKKFGRHSYQGRINSLSRLGLGQHSVNSTAQMGRLEGREIPLSTEEPKTVSIVTVTIGCNPDLEITKDSILPILKECGDVEWVIKSANEGDFQSLGILSHPQIKLDICNDSGIYEAMNQAASLCDGRFMIFIGGGDCLIKESFRLAVSMLRRSHDAPSIVYFPAIMEGWASVWHPHPLDLDRRMSCPHAGMFIRTDNFFASGSYSESYKIAGDYDLVSRMVVNKVDLCWVGVQPVVFCKGGGISVVRFLEAFLEETVVRLRVWRKGYSEVAKDISGYLSGPFRLLNQKKQTN